MVKIGRACIDRYEAHLVKRESDGTRSVASHVERPNASVHYEARSARGVFPQAYISRVEAKAACVNAGKRLCSMTEWRRACQGSRASLYPYGPRYRAGACNSGKPHLLTLRFGETPGNWRYDENFNDPTLDEEPGFLAASGAYPDCASDVGVLDLIGNLHEWVSDSVDESFMRRLDSDAVDRRKQPWRRGNGVFVGGFFSTIRELGPGCKFVTVAHEPTYHDYSTGFRCCAPVMSEDVP
jgi:formylglycine-generating enzyme required for sulfatase activity